MCNKYQTEVLTTDKEGQHLNTPNEDGGISNKGDETQLAQAADQCKANQNQNW